MIFQLFHPEITNIYANENRENKIISFNSKCTYDYLYKIITICV